MPPEDDNPNPRGDREILRCLGTKEVEKMTDEWWKMLRGDRQVA